MLIVLAAALLPALILMWYVYNKDTQPEPTRLIVKGFFYGGLATFVSTLISGPLMAMGFFSGEPTSLSECLTTSFFGAAIPEECAKLLMLWLLLRNNPEFDERFDGIVYAASVGLGFAAFENILYVMGSGADWITVSISRALLAVPGHFAFAVMMGYYYSVNHFYGSYAPKGTKAKIILVPILLHGIYDTIAFASGLGSALSGLLTIVLLYFCFRLFKYTRARILSEASDNDIRSKIMRDSAPDDNLPDEQ
ncbi:MAG: PrsW family intramembrane metalloprotease [Bacteroidales bacterium]|nr:PrsW family intramembrane metalloprotease [Bacteroidales bacterium]